MTFEENKEEDSDSSDEEAKVSPKVVIMTVTNGYDRLYRVALTHKFMEQQRRASQIEGSWQSYFELL